MYSISIITVYLTNEALMSDWNVMMLLLLLFLLKMAKVTHFGHIIKYLSLPLCVFAHQYLVLFVILTISSFYLSIYTATTPIHKGIESDYTNENENETDEISENGLLFETHWFTVNVRQGTVHFIRQRIFKFSIEMQTFVFLRCEFILQLN